MTDVELSEMQGKKVALVDIDGEETARRIVEVALINQLVQRGSFVIVSKEDVEAARQAYAQNPRDWKGIARRAGADYAVDAKVLDFDATEHSGYSSEKVEDSQLAAEQGEDARYTDHIYKVKSLEGHVRISLDFAPVGGSVKNANEKTGIAEAQDKVVADAKDGAIHLPPRLRFLEKLSNDAFRRFFDDHR